MFFQKICTLIQINTTITNSTIRELGWAEFFSGPNGVTRCLHKKQTALLVTWECIMHSITYELMPVELFEGNFFLKR
jgi:hypothetical protein